MLYIKSASRVAGLYDEKSQGLIRYHDFDEFVYWKKGHGTYFVGDKTFRYDKGFFVNIPRGTHHGVIRESPDETILIHYENTDPSLPVPAAVFKCNQNHIAYIESIAKEVDNATPYTSAAISAQLTMLFIEIARESIKNSDISDTISRSLNYMHNNYASRITLKELADLCSYSINNYLYLLKKAMNCTPMEYLLKRRLSAAVTLLLGTAMSIAEIAVSCGFYDTAHFTRTFKNHYGVSPLKYRQNHIFY